MDEVGYMNLRAEIISRGFGHEVEWAESVTEPETALAFACEYVWVVLNSGMKNQIAAGIWKRLRPVLEAGGSAHDAFGHKGKAAAIDKVWQAQDDYLAGYLSAGDKLAYCQSLPWIGPITKWHLAKNLGLDVAKPDRHLQRIADQNKETPQGLCARLAKAVGDRIATVDQVIWRAANLGLV